MDVAQLRKTVHQAIEGARKDASARRVRADAASLAYERFLEERATPVFRSMANVLKSEGLLFDVMTPSGGVRLVPERTREDGIELTLDATFDPPRATLTTVRSRGSRTMRAVFAPSSRRARIACRSCEPRSGWRLTRERSLSWNGVELMRSLSLG